PRRRRVPILVAVLALVSVAATVAAAGAGASASSRFSVSGPALQADSTYSASKSQTGQLARTDASLLNRTDSTLVNVMIKYDFDVAASYTGGVPGLKATSPRVTGKSLRANAGAVAAYNAYTSKKATRISGLVTQAVPTALIRQTYRNA